MGISISENLKKLRRGRDLTQEGLADILGVSAQSISKWERGDNFPDITLLPGIANFFDVTVDDLLGMAAIRDAKRVEEVAARRAELVAEGKSAEAHELVRDLAREMPNNHEVQMMYAQTIDLNGIVTETREEFTARRQNALAIYQRVLDGSTDDAIRSRANAAAANVCVSIGDLDGAYEYADKLPSLSECREILRLRITQLAASRAMPQADMSFKWYLDAVDAAGVDITDARAVDAWTEENRELIRTLQVQQLSREPVDPVAAQKYSDELRETFRTILFAAQDALRSLSSFKRRYGAEDKGENIELLKLEIPLQELIAWCFSADSPAMHENAYHNLAIEYMEVDRDIALDYAVKAVDCAALTRDARAFGTSYEIGEDGKLEQVPWEGTAGEASLGAYESDVMLDPIRDRPEFVAAMARLRGEG
ncbi:MAG: helix-turn-helix domain-containing protein [Oscillospiraceae bacterium]|jgi:transcriptional regulator with XRE-family HTH domain|nr:helix-turn-helix domain-containing protein [Oscillospiraceae bacterium]